MTIISYSEFSAVEMVEKIKENMNAFSNGDADSIDHESLQEYANKIDEMTNILVSKDGASEHSKAIEMFREHVVKIHEYMNTEKDPADARFIGKNAVSAFFAGIADSLGIGLDKPASGIK